MGVLGTLAGGAGLLTTVAMDKVAIGATEKLAKGIGKKKGVRKKVRVHA